MLKHSCKVCTDPNYSSGDFASDCQENCVCCVVDANHREERFCAFTTVDPNTHDWFDCGHANESDMEDPHIRQRRQNERWVRRLFIVGLLIWGAVGVIAVIDPTAVMFNVVVDEEYRSKLEEGKRMQESVARLEEKKKEEERGANVIIGFLNELLRSEKLNEKDREKDRTAVMHVLELASEKLQSAHCAAVVVTAPIKVYGAACIFYALTCMFLWFEEVRMLASVTSTHLAWYTCSLIGYALSTAGHGRTMESSIFTTCMLAFSAIMAIAWIIMRERIMSYTARVRQSDAQPSSEIKPV